jgi:CelD/BcsL family acetyltransferase involved in cellulose biosynthesis
LCDGLEASRDASINRRPSQESLEETPLGSRRVVRLGAARVGVRMAEHFVESVNVAVAETHLAAWRDLCGRALEANVFAEPGFLVAAARHIAPRGLEFLFVWADERRERLLGAMALALPRLGVIEIWQSEQAGLAGLVFDRDSAAAAFDAATEWLDRKRRVAGLFVPTLAAEGETARLLEGFTAHRALRLAKINPRQRAILYAATDFERTLSGKRAAKLRRQRRRLSASGPLVFRSAQTGAALEAAAEAFLALEPKSWKGRGGAPLAADPGRAAFARCALAALAAEGKLRIDSLDLAGAPIAMAVLLSSNDRAFYWKTAYDEAFAEFSPGVLLALDVSRKQQGEPNIAAIDSCAIEGHPMIERLWPQRLDLVDCLVGLRPSNDWRLNLWLATRELTRRLKGLVKRALFPLLGRKQS